jgi:UDP-N-acetylglucosamine--N-acetylmuramyl-(pentapeptide) pyrophosphoryl-undecaprenol N-acetylglucosamine transferase
MKKSQSQKFVIALTGGGTAGHVMPHLALLPEFKKLNYEVFYIGSAGIEKSIIAGTGMPFEQIAAGKLRRYFSWENFLDVFRIALGVYQSLKILSGRRPNVIFSKGGFVSVPVAVAGWLLRIPVVSHESDLTPGLANRIIAKFAKKILYTFKETQKYLPADKSQYVGLPIRLELAQGESEAGVRLCGFESDWLPSSRLILIMGGSLGAQRLNEAIEEILPALTQEFFVVHITGKGKGLKFVHPRYKSFEYVADDLKHLFKITDYVISRAGANSIFEFLFLNIPMLLIPLEAGSRGDQIQNAAYFAKNNWSHVLREADATGKNVMDSIQSLVKSADEIKKAQRDFDAYKVASSVVQLLASVGKPQAE